MCVMQCNNALLKISLLAVFIYVLNVFSYVSAQRNYVEK